MPVPAPVPMPVPVSVPQPVPAAAARLVRHFFPRRGAEFTEFALDVPAHGIVTRLCPSEHKTLAERSTWASNRKMVVLKV